jgi:hypothetical protein
METETVSTQAAPDTGTADADAGSIDQSSYVNDAWETNYFKSHEAELNPNAKQAQAPKDPAKQEPVKPGDKQAEPPKVDEKAKTPDKQESQPSRFEKAFAGENGEMDLDKFMNFNIPDVKFDKPADVGTPASEPAVKQEQWQKDQEEVTKLQTTLHGELLGPLEKIGQLIDGGKDPIEALREVYAERKAFVESHLSEVKSNKEFQRQKALEERLMEKTNTEKQAALSATNTNEIISSLPGKDTAEKTELFNEILFGTSGGSEMLNYYFREKVPNLDKLTPAEKNAEAAKFINSITSDKAKLRFMFKQALAIQTHKSMPQILQKARISAVAAHKSNALSAQKAPLGTQKRTAPPPGKGLWDDYLSSPSEVADRV